MKMKNDETGEAQAEVITAGLLMLVLGGFMLGSLGDQLAMLAGGLVLLGSGVYQTTRGWHVGLPTWILGGVLTLGGLGTRMFLVTYTRINFVAITLILMGIYFMFQVLRPRS